MGRGANESSSLLYGPGMRSAGEKASNRRRLLGDDVRLSLSGDWARTVGALFDNRSQILSEDDWARGLLEEVAASLPRGEDDADLDFDRVAEELRELLSHPELDADFLSRCRLGVPEALLALDDVREGGAASLLVERLADPDNCRVAPEVLVEAPRRGAVFERASEGLASSWIDERLDQIEDKAGFLLRTVNGLDLDVWRTGRKGALIHIAAPGEDRAEKFLCGKEISIYSFYPTDRGELRLSLDGAHPEGTRTCPRCLRRAEKDGHPSLSLQGSETAPPPDLRERVHAAALAPVVTAIDAATDVDQLDEESLEDSLEAGVQAGLRGPAVELLLEIPEDQRWRRLMGDRVDRDSDIADCTEWPSFPDDTAHRVLDYISYVSGNEHTRRSTARSKAAEVFKVRAGIRDLEEEKREAEEKRRNWRRWDRGRNHTDYSLGKELHLFVDSGGEPVLGGAILARAACGSSASYDPGHSGNRYGSAKCAKCEELERELFPVAA